MAATPVYIEPGPLEQGIRYRDGQPELLQTHTVWRPFCGSDTTNFTVADLKLIAERTKVAAAAFPPPAERLGGPAKFDLVFNVISSLPPGAAEALLEVERYVEAQFDDPITVTVTFQFASLPPGVLGATGSSYTSASYTNTRNGLQADMDGSDSIQDHLPGGATLPVRYDGNLATVTNESTVFITRANYRAAIGSVGGTAANITFSSNFSWDYTPPAISGGTTCFQSVIVHEVGHALGFVSAADFRPNDVEMLDLYRFQRSDGAGDYNPDTVEEFATTARMVDQNAPGTDDDVNSDLISAEWRMSDGNPNQASHFRDNANIGIMDPTISSGISFFPNYYRTADLDMFDAIGYDYPHENTSCLLAMDLACNDVRHFDNLPLSSAPNPAFSCGVGVAHTGRAWFSFVATAASANISTCGSPGTDSTWAVYSGVCGSLVEIACSEDGGCGSGNNSSMCVTGLTPGETYYVQFASKTAATRGVYSIDIKCSCDGACCVPPPSLCRVLDEQECATNGGTFIAGGVECPVDDTSLIELCGVLDPVVEQFATGNQEDLASDVDWSDSNPNSVVADGIRGDGRPVHQVRWWGSVLDETVVPDGWLISFHEPLAASDPAAEALAVYFCGAEVVTSAATSLTACDAEGVIDYSANLADCCLVHAGIDSRSLATPGQPGAFQAESCVDYSMSIGALAGQRYDLQAGSCVGSSTAEIADGAFWGWHTSVVNSGGTLIRGPVDTGLATLPYGPWNAATGACGEPNMAVSLLTYAPASPVQLAWDTGAPDGQQRLNSQMGGQFTDYLTADDFELSETSSIVELRWIAEEENAFVWQNRVRLEIYPDTGSGAPDESGGPTHAYWIPDDLGSVSRISLGAGAFFPRYRYEVSGIDLSLASGNWWIGLASAASSPTGRTFWLTSRTLSLDGSIIGAQAHYRRPSAGVSTFTQWSTLLVGEQHDMSLEIDVVVPRDCNCNTILDHVELGGGATDCNSNGVIDECEPDCNENGIADECDIAAMTSFDCQGNGLPDECDLTYAISGDSDADQVLDECDVCPGHSDLADADDDGVPDGCDVCPGFDDTIDADSDGVPNGCDNCSLPNSGQEDCQPNGVGDLCELADATSRDCNQNDIPDECDGIATPETPLPEPGGVNMNRYLAIVPGNAGEMSAIRITLSTLHVPNPPNLVQFPPPDFSAFNGQVRWVGPPMVCPDATSFWCSKLQCTPHYADWESIVGLATLYVTGAEVIPSSQYNVQTITTGCNEGAETSYSVALPLQTARWGDVHPPFQTPSPDSVSQPNVIDIGVTVDKVKGISGAIPKPRAHLKGNDPNPSENVNVIEIGFVVDALKGFAYPFSGPVACP